MIHKDFPRILVGSCTKCGGALKEQTDPGEWMCINCGSLVMNKTAPKPLVKSKPVVEVPEKRGLLDLMETTVAGVIEEVKEVVEEEDSAVTLKALEEEEEEGDDQEWAKLTKFSEEKR